MNHLNEEQIAELLSASSRELGELPELAEAQAHAAACTECAAELVRMQESLAFFREASTAYADAHVQRVPAFQPPIRRPFFQPALWATAAAAVLLAAFVPTQLRRPVPPIQQPVNVQPAPPPSESDEALLESVNREVSESVPTPMAALADPTGSASQASQNSTQRTN
jgi:anti-sigma factor RsiW